MRAFIIFLVSCAAVLGADTGIRVVTSVHTNESGMIFTKDVFTRDGQTNLVCNSSIVPVTADGHTNVVWGPVQVRVHRFYHSGSLIGMWISMPDYTCRFIPEPGSPYSLSVEFNGWQRVQSAVVANKDGAILDAFNYTNGVFSPAESSVIAKANSAASEVRRAMDKLSEESKKSEGLR